MPAKVMPLVRYFVNNATLSARCDKKNLLWQEEVHQHAVHRCQADQNNPEAPPARLKGGRGSFKQDHRGDELDQIEKPMPNGRMTIGKLRGISWARLQLTIAGPHL